MARLSKAKHFQIYEDHDNTETAEITHQKHISVKSQTSTDDDSQWDYESQQFEEDGEAEGEEVYNGEDQFCDVDFDQEHRVSEITSTSISSFPDSTTQGDGNWTLSIQAPPVIRPAFRRPQSVFRMQMSSPPLLQSTIRPDSPFSIDAKDSACSRPRTNVRNTCRTSEGTEESDSGDESRSYPLVLLHVTLLPVSLPWSMELMELVLPAHILENLHLLRSKASETIVQRGILIPHPREEYDILEERLLQALDLEVERITKCGHFRSRPSTDSTITASSSDSVPSDQDSGIGSSDSESRICDTCSRQIKLAAAGTGKGKRLWSIRVFAANGLMRSAAWAAAWNEMESVDVEIFPWIDEHYKRELDRRKEEQDTEEDVAQEEEARRIRELVEREVQQAYEMKRRLENLTSMDQVPETLAKIHVRREELSQESSEGVAGGSPPKSDLPREYHASQIPISLLLKNYVFLLSQDRRNVAIVLLAIIAMYLVLGPKDLSQQVCTIQRPHLGSIQGHLDGEPSQLPLAMADWPDQLQPTAMNMTEPPEYHPASEPEDEVLLLLSEELVHLGEDLLPESDINNWVDRDEDLVRIPRTVELQPDPRDFDVMDDSDVDYLKVD